MSAIEKRILAALASILGVGAYVYHIHHRSLAPVIASLTPEQLAQRRDSVANTPGATALLDALNLSAAGKNEREGVSGTANPAGQPSGNGTPPAPRGNSGGLGPLSSPNPGSELRPDDLSRAAP